MVFLCACLCDQIYPIYWDPSYTGSEPTLLLYDLFLTNHLSNDPISKQGHILRYQGLYFIWMCREHNEAHNKGRKDCSFHSPSRSCQCQLLPEMATLCPIRVTSISFPGPLRVHLMGIPSKHQYSALHSWEITDKCNCIYLKCTIWFNIHVHCGIIIKIKIINTCINSNS